MIDEQILRQFKEMLNNSHFKWLLFYLNDFLTPKTIKRIEKISLIIGIILFICLFIILKYYDFDKGDYIYGINGFDIMLFTFLFLTLSYLEKIIIWIVTKKNHMTVKETTFLYLTIFMLIIRIFMIIFGKY